MSIQLQFYVSHLVSTMKSFRGLKTVFILPPHTYGNKHQRAPTKGFKLWKGVRVDRVRGKEESFIILSNILVKIYLSFWVKFVWFQQKKSAKVFGEVKRFRSARGRFCVRNRPRSKNFRLSVHFSTVSVRSILNLISLYKPAVILWDSASSFHWLSSSIFSVRRLFVRLFVPYR